LFGLGKNFVRVNRAQNAFGNLRECLAFGCLDDFGFHGGIEAAFQADEATERMKKTISSGLISVPVAIMSTVTAMRGK
jgi:hypothetical protein